MQPFSFETSDIVVIGAVVIATTVWSFRRLDKDIARVDRLTTKGQRVPWRFRHYAGKSKNDLQADLVGRGIGFFLMLMGFIYLKTLGLSMGYRLAASLALFLVLFSTLPRLFIALGRLVRPSRESDSH